MRADISLPHTDVADEQHAGLIRALVALAAGGAAAALGVDGFRSDAACSAETLQSASTAMLANTIARAVGPPKDAKLHKDARLAAERFELQLPYA